ncbi:hypothetical protein IMG5_079040, partial [Ichthyophthirius multifiliis]
ISNSTILYIKNSILNEIFVVLESFINDFLHSNITIYINNLKIIHSKLLSAILIFPYAAIFDKEDIFSNFNDQKFDELKRKVKIIQLADPIQLQKSFKNIVRTILVANAAISKGNEQNSTLLKLLYQNFGCIYYFFEQSKAKQRAQLFYCEPRPSVTIKVLNMMDEGIYKHAMSLIFPYIKCNMKIYIEQVENKISLQNLQKEILLNTQNKINKIQQKTMHFIRNNIEKYIQELFIKNNEKIKIRILCSEIIQKYPFQNKQFFKKIIIHIHGGGFIAMSSRCHQTYTRQWANKLNIPIFSIDYKKAPKYPYPEALNDCWQAYNWILNYVQKCFNIKPINIVLVGDSAGGNLITSLTLRCIKSGVRYPDGLLLCYPALNLNMKTFTPSILWALDDQIIPHTFLQICLDSYIPEHLNVNLQKDPFASPINASYELLKQFPPVRIMVGSKDPLHDDCWRFLKRLMFLFYIYIIFIYLLFIFSDIKKDAKLYVYSEMPHGFLNYDSPNGMKEAKQCVQDAYLILEELINYSN